MRAARLHESCCAACGQCGDRENLLGLRPAEHSVWSAGMHELSVDGRGGSRRRPGRDHALGASCRRLWAAEYAVPHRAVHATELGLLRCLHRSLPCPQAGDQSEYAALRRRMHPTAASLDRIPPDLRADLLRVECEQGMVPRSDSERSALPRADHRVLRGRGRVDYPDCYGRNGGSVLRCRERPRTRCSVGRIERRAVHDGSSTGG